MFDLCFGCRVNLAGVPQKKTVPQGAATIQITTHVLYIYINTKNGW